MGQYSCFVYGNETILSDLCYTFSYDNFTCFKNIALVNRYIPQKVEFGAIFWALFGEKSRTARFLAKRNQKTKCQQQKWSKSADFARQLKGHKIKVNIKIIFILVENESLWCILIVRTYNNAYQILNRYLFPYISKLM